MKTIRSKQDWSLSPRILDRYVAREYLISYLIAIVVVLSLRILIDLFVEFDEFIETDPMGAAPGTLEVIRNIGGYYAPKLFEYFRDFSGTLILLAAAFSLARMRRHNELVAVLASGLSLKRLIAPIVLLGVGLNLVMVLDQELVLPRLADKLARRHDEMRQLRLISNLFLPDRDGSLVRARLYDPSQEKMTDVLVILRKEGRMRGYLRATEARWDGTAWGLTEGKLYHFQDSDEPVADSDSILHSQERWESNLTPEYLWVQRNAQYKNLMSNAELSDLLKRSLRPAERAEAISEKHFRLTDPIINMVMLLLGLPMLVSRERRNTRTAIFYAFVGAGGCYIATFVCKLLAGGGIYVDTDFTQLLVVWMPVMIFLPLSILALDGIKT